MQDTAGKKLERWGTGPDGHPTVVPDGVWCNAGDVAALEAERDRLQAEVARRKAKAAAWKRAAKHWRNQCACMDAPEMDNACRAQMAANVANGRRADG